MSSLKRLLPFLEWPQIMNRATLRADMVAGASTALVLVPLSMANAQLAGLPAYYGLYAGSIPCIIGGLFGSSRQLITCAVALICLMTAAALEPLAAQGSETFISHAILLTMMVGLFQLILGALRLGVLVNFVSHPVIGGFTTAGALIIIISQIGYVLGVTLDSSDSFLLTIWETARSVVHIHWPTFAFGIGVMTLMIVLRLIHRRMPHVLIAVGLVTFISWATGYEHNQRISLSQIADPETQESLGEFQKVARQVQHVSEQRQQTLARQRLVASESGKHSREAVRLQSRIDLLEMDLAQAKARMRMVRQGLHEQVFRQAIVKDRPVFVSRDNNDPIYATSPDARKWRLSVPREAIEDGKILMQGGGIVVGNIPSGIPAFTPPLIEWDSFMQLLNGAILIALFGFMNAMSLAKAVAAHTGQRINPNRELFGQGLANFIGSFFRSSPVSPSFTGSTVNFTSGAVTGLSSVIAGALVLATLVLLSPLLYHIPKAALGGVVIVSVAKLVNFGQFKRAWKTHPHDGIVAIGTFLCTIAFTPDLNKGIFAGILLSLGLYLYRRMFPHVVTLSLHNDGAYRDAHRYGLQQCRHIAAVRFDGSLFFANAAYLEDKILERISEMPELKHVLIDGSTINDLDASGVETLSQQIDHMRQAGYDLSISGLRSPILDTMRRTGLLKKIGEDHLFLTVAEAAQALHAKSHENSDEKCCPLLEVCPREERDPSMEPMIG